MVVQDIWSRAASLNRMSHMSRASNS